MTHGENAPLLYQETAVDNRLRRYLLGYWKFEYFPDDKSQKIPLCHTILPDGCVSVIARYNSETEERNVFLFGPRIHNYETVIEAFSIFTGVRLFPGAVQALFGITGSDLRDKTFRYSELPAEWELSGLADDLQPEFADFRKYDRFFISKIDESIPEPDPVVTAAVNTILDAAGKIRAAEVASQCGLGVRQLQRRFREDVGLTLKEFARIRRLRTAVIRLLLEDAENHDVFFNSGYFDQAHFNRDFSMVVGTNPSVFRRYISRIKHLGVGT